MNIESNKLFSPYNNKSSVAEKQSHRSFYHMNRSYNKYFNFTPNIVDARRDPNKKSGKRCRSALPANQAKINWNNADLKLNKEEKKVVHKIKNRLGRNRVKLSTLLEYGQKKEEKVKKAKIDTERTAFTKFLKNISMFEDPNNLKNMH